MLRGMELLELAVFTRMLRRQARCVRCCFASDYLPSPSASRAS